jgi:hypothetical protein
MTRKFSFLTVMLAFLAALAWSLPAAGDTISGTITADNYFVLYKGAADGSGLTKIIGGDEWSTPVSFPSTEVGLNERLYVVAWNGGSNDVNNPQAWLGQIDLPSGRVYSDLTKWQYIYVASGTQSPIAVTNAIAKGGENKAWLSATPVIAPNPPVTGPAIGDEMKTANTSPNNGDNLWLKNHGGPIAGIDPGANWIWFDTFAGSASQNGYAVFRLAEAPVPIPASALLLGSGLLGLGLLGFRRQKS